jgi:hypothetical protein
VILVYRRGGGRGGDDRILLAEAQATLLGHFTFSTA